jgi:hypothetical protein
MQSLISSVVSGFHSTPLPPSALNTATAPVPIPRASDACRRSENQTAVCLSRDLMQLREEILGQHAAAVGAQPAFSVAPKPKLSAADLDACEPVMDAFREVLSFSPFQCTCC